MVATHDAKPKYDPRTDAALDAAEPACRLARELIDEGRTIPAERRQKVEQIVGAIQQLALECSRNANDAAMSRQILQRVTGVDHSRTGRGLSVREQRANDEAYVKRLDGDWPQAIEAVRTYGVRFWATCIAEAERNGCEPAHVLDLLALCKDNASKFREPPGELFHRIRQACPGLDAYDGWSIGSLPRPKPPTFDELLAREFNEEIRERNANGSGCDPDLIRRWVAFHKLHGEAAKESVQNRLHLYTKRLNEADIRGPERANLIDRFFETCGLNAPVPTPRREKAGAR